MHRVKTNSEEFLKPKNGPVTFILVAINIIVFIVLEFMGDTRSGGFMLLHGAMNPYLILSNGEWYRLFTCMFLHFGIEHLANNMLLLFLLGQIFERAVGVTRYIGIYIGAGLAGSFLSFFYMCLMGQNDIVAGASGAIFGIIGGMIVVIGCNGTFVCGMHDFHGGADPLFWICISWNRQCRAHRRSGGRITFYTNYLWNSNTYTQSSR